MFLSIDRPNVNIPLFLSLYLSPPSLPLSLREEEERMGDQVQQGQMVPEV